jgi:acyl-CoA thioesterase-1
VDYVQRALDAKGYRYRVVNEGVSGDTTSNGLERLGQVTELKPAVVILELGGNDGLRGIPVESTRANLEEMIAALEQAGATVVLAGMTLPANYGPDYIGRFERMYEELARKHDLRLIEFRLEKLGGMYEELMQRDGLHPTREGHRRLGEYVARELEPVLRR